jgi:hypothetical protein
MLVIQENNNCIVNDTSWDDDPFDPSFELNARNQI